MKPTIGRIVHYHPRNLSGTTPIGPFAAIVIAVNEVVDTGMLPQGEMKFREEGTAFEVTSPTGEVSSYDINDLPKTHEADLCVFHPVRGLETRWGVPYASSPQAGHWNWPPREGDKGEK